MATFSCSSTQFQWWNYRNSTCRLAEPICKENFTLGGQCWLMGAYEWRLIALKMLDQTPWGNYPLSCLYIYKHVCALSGYSKGAAHQGQTWGHPAACARAGFKQGQPDPMKGCVCFSSLSWILALCTCCLFLSALKSVPIANEVEMQRTIYGFEDFVCLCPSTIKQNV